MNFKTCFALILAAVVAVSVTAEEDQAPKLLYCQATGCPPLYSKANLDVSQKCRNEGHTGDDFHDCCETKCGATPQPGQ
ncbi:small cysteine-rich protein SCR91 [Phytophthora cinnamomi]|uniref:small cysteine-rich protein SCR91 n=1 Tax=Phytophthora cinnamomi TaxID=4785 RepID=UPI0035596B08|nr:small cysteine-rich protein SCR91 [Phytophthora cinnamomi]